MPYDVPRLEALPVAVPKRTEHEKERGGIDKRSRMIKMGSDGAKKTLRTRDEKKRTKGVDKKRRMIKMGVTGKRKPRAAQREGEKKKAPPLDKQDGVIKIRREGKPITGRR